MCFLCGFGTKRLLCASGTDLEYRATMSLTDLECGGTDPTYHDADLVLLTSFLVVLTSVLVVPGKGSAVLGGVSSVLAGLYALSHCHTRSTSAIRALPVPSNTTCCSSTVHAAYNVQDRGSLTGLLCSSRCTSVEDPVAVVLQVGPEMQID